MDSGEYTRTAEKYIDTVYRAAYSYCKNKEDAEDAVQNVFMKLPKNYSTIIHLYYYEGYDVKEISGILGISESNVQIRLMRARNKLRSILKEA